MLHLQKIQCTVKFSNSAWSTRNFWSCWIEFILNATDVIMQNSAPRFALKISGSHFSVYMAFGGTVFVDLKVTVILLMWKK